MSVCASLQSPGGQPDQRRGERSVSRPQAAGETVSITPHPAIRVCLCVSEDAVHQADAN